MTSTLIADRFVCYTAGATGELSALDAATGQLVDVHIVEAGSRAEQEAWAGGCAARFGHPRERLIDYGVIGKDRRFEAYRRKRLPPPSARQALISYAVEWLEGAGPASSKIFRLASAPDGQALFLAREARLRGFVPVNVSILADEHVGPAIALAVTGRSVVLLAERPSEMALALAFLRLRATARMVSAIVGSSAPALRTRLIAHAAESRTAFGTRGPGGTGMAMLDAARRLTAAGRHAAAERQIRAALANFNRRNDAGREADAHLALGRLLLDRGRTSEALARFENACEKYRELGAAALAVQACVGIGVAQTDLGRFDQADGPLRTSHSAAAALREPGLQLSVSVAWARNMFWQGAYADATALLESTALEGEPDSSARYWCLAARLRLVANDLPGAWTALTQARDWARKSGDPGCDAMVRTAEATVQAKLGDVEALVLHVRAGLRAAASAHLPLRGVRLRLALIEGLLDSGKASPGREVGRRLQTMSRMPLPPILQRRLDRAVHRLATPAVHESAPSFCAATAVIPGNDGDVDGLTRVLSLCHDVEDEREALSRAAAAIRKQTGALAVAIHGSAGDGIVPLGTTGTANAELSRRCIGLGQPIGPERIVGGVEAATPVRYLGRVVGSVTSRWTVDGPGNADRAMAFGKAAAAACAPLVYILLQRDANRPAPVEDAHGELVGTSAAIVEVRRAIARAANAPFTVLIEGESGSGKELVARAIHRAGCRRNRALCVLNCAAMPEDLLDAELFGHAKGAFTGAAAERPGLFESADEGTVFLDEVGELSARAQAKLLRVLQEGEIRRIGENFTRPIDARLIAATNRSLRSEAMAGRFRQDLLYRLDVIRIVVPPLRDRVEDIPLLATRLWAQAAGRIGSKAVLGQGALSSLARYDWPGNVRELQNVLAALVVSVPPRGLVGASQLPAAITRAMTPMALETLDAARLRFEQRFVRAVMAQTAGQRGRAATALGMSRQGLAKLLRRLQLDE